MTMLSPTDYLDALLALPHIWSAASSPDGKWIAWTWYRVAPTPEVFVVPVDGSQPPIRLTDTAESTYFVSWTPDSRAVIVEQDQDGNERAQLFRIDLTQPLHMEPLTAPNPNYFIRGGDLHPNGKWLVYGANFDVHTGEEIEPTYVYRHDLETSERKILARPEKGGYISVALSPDGAHVLYTRMDLNPAGRQLWLVGIDGANDREIINFGANVKAYGSWFADGQHILIQGETATHTRIGVYTLATGELRWLLDDPTRNIEGAYIPHNSSQIVVIEVQQARVKSSLLDPITSTETILPPIAGDFTLIAPIPNTNEHHWTARVSSSTQPPEIMRVSLDDLRAESHAKAFMSLSKVWERTSLTRADLASAHDFRWKSVDGLEIQGWLYRPQGEARGTIVYVHGGPTWNSFDTINAQIQFYVRSGFNVLDPNYRGSTGFSLAYRESIKEDGWGGREQDDIRTGIEALITAGIAQAGKVGITGTSYGGYSSWHAITHFPTEILAASAPICGMTDLVVDYETTRPDLRPYSKEMMGGSPSQVPERYYERSPINFVQNIAGRLLIIQGMQDPNVTPENVRTVTAALQTAGIEYELLAFEDEGHGITKRQNQKTLYLRLVEFFGSL